MMAEFGVWLLILALMLSALQSLYLLPAPSIRHHLKPCMTPLSWLQFALVLNSFMILMMLRIDSDFSVSNVAQHSNLALPLLYKIAGTWGNHEGSMVLWALVLVAFGALLATRDTSHEKRLALAVQAALAVGILAFIVFTSNPFTRIFPPPYDGQALNPLLQDFALAMHPPLLYIGYVGFSLVFSLSVAGLMIGKIDDAWAKHAHPWILGAWAALTIGIGLGSWWAYRELGWGGWWFWDPVENASLLPWLCGTALLHSNIVLKKRGQLASWVALLAILTFALSLLGTFLVRSGLLTSVHSFASDPARGTFILAYIAISVGGALFLFGVRPTSNQNAPTLRPFSREGLLLINNLFLLVACATVLLGTLYPLVAEWLYGYKINVGPAYFNQTFLPLMALPIWFAGVAMFTPWKKAALKPLLRSLNLPFIFTLIFGILILFIVKTHLLLALCGFLLAAWLLFSSALHAYKQQFRTSCLPVVVSHIGVAIFVIGLTGSGLWSMEKEAFISKGEVLELGDYRVIYEGESRFENTNHQTIRGRFQVQDQQGKHITTLEPEYRFYPISKLKTSEAAIDASASRDIYIVIGETAADKTRISARIYVKPMMGLIWAGCVLMALGALIAFFKPKLMRS